MQFKMTALLQIHYIENFIATNWKGFLFFQNEAGWYQLMSTGVSFNETLNIQIKFKINQNSIEIFFFKCNHGKKIPLKISF